MDRRTAWTTVVVACTAVLGGTTGSAAAAGATELVSLSSGGRQATFSVYAAALDRSGRYATWTSDSGVFAAGDTNGRVDVFVRDTVAGTTERVSVSSAGVQGDGFSTSGSLSDGGQVVAFTSTSRLVAGDTNGFSDAYVRDRVAGTTTRVSTSSTGRQAQGSSSAVDVSADGRFVLFSSEAADLVAGDTNDATDAFVHDRTTRTTQRVSLGSRGGQRPGHSFPTSISADGRFVSYTAAPPGGVQQVYLRDRLRGRTVLVSQTPTAAPGAGTSGLARVSDDGRRVAFVSTAADLVAGDTGGSDVFVRDLAGGTTRRIGVGGGNTDISGNGRYVISQPAGSSDLYRFDLTTRERRRMAVTPDGARPDNYSYLGPNAFSHDGRRLLFLSDASDLVPRDTNGYYTDAFLRHF